MSLKSYRDKNCNLDALLDKIESWFTQRGYQTQVSKSDQTLFLQAAKTETWRKMVGASRAFNVLIQGQPEDFSIDLGTGEWASNLTAGGVAALLTGGATLLVSGVTVGWSKKIEGDLWQFIDHQITFGEKPKSVQELSVQQSQEVSEVKLRQLKEAYDQKLIDERTYTTKKLEIEQQMISDKQRADLETKLQKLKGLFEEGILSQAEYEAKKAELMPAADLEKESKFAKLEAAFNAGILSQEEFEAKKIALEKQAKLETLLTQLEEARSAGIITQEEFEQKKAKFFE